MSDFVHSKARMLEKVKSLNSSLFQIPEMLFFSVDTIENNFNSVLEKIQNTFDNCTLAIRSSAADEDGQNNSIAGGYTSVLNVTASNKKKIVEAINTVISSYKKKRSLHSNDEVIIQKMVQSSNMSGVIFTHDLNTGAPYYVINYDDMSGITDTVTSGSGEYANRTLYVYRNSIEKLKSDRFKMLLKAVKELESMLKSEFLDIEFVLDKNFVLHLLQVRLITTQINWNQKVKKNVNATLQGVHKFITAKFKKQKGIYGNTTALGQMPDWNPVEMIGRIPRTLAASLYQKFITNDAWRIARSEMGYKVPTGEPLMLMLAGQPYIDTRLSFNSFLPSNISPIIAEKLVNHWIDKLIEKPEYHDKIEFEIAITCYSFDFDHRVEKLIGNILTEQEKLEFKQAHKKQTMALIRGKNEDSMENSLKKIEKLQEKQKYQSTLFGMIEDCVQLGTIPFSILARHGFIAKTILLSLCQLKIISNDEVNKLLRSINTVASELVDEMHLLQLNKLSIKKFLNKFGHLRPGTYDIMSLRYDQMKDLTYSSNVTKAQKKIYKFEFSKSQQVKIDELLKNHGFENLKVNDLLIYINQATINREYSKFVFTRSVSSIIEHIMEFAENNGLSREEISHIPIDMILSAMTNSNEQSIEEKLRKYSEQESERHNINASVRLPQIISNQADAFIVPFQVSHANFITNKKVTAPSVVLYSNIEGVSISEKIVIIEGADPGFDWIFSQKISGLITKYGGANSHMAIRCAEFGLPAAIGCGEQKFEQLLKSNQVHLDCSSGLIKPLN